MTKHHTDATLVNFQSPTLADLVCDFLNYRITRGRPLEVAIAGLFLAVAAGAGFVAGGL